MAWGRIYRKGDSYYTDVRHHGQRRRKKIGKNRQVAEKILQKILGDLTLSDHGIMSDEKITLRNFAVEYLAAKKQTLRPLSYTRVASIFKVHLLRAFGHLYLYDIGPEKYYAYQSKRLGHSASNASLNRELSVLRNMVTTAISWKKLKVNPLAGVKQLKESPGRTRFLNADEIKKLLANCPPPPHPLRDIIVTALCSGMRKSEILGLRWEWIKLEERIILLPNSKTNSARIVPVNESLFHVLAAMPEKTGFVFGNGHKPIGNVRKSYLTACKKAGITGFTFHGLRHSYASLLVLQGVHVRTLMDLMGHKTLAMCQRYTHLAPGELQNSVKLLDGIIEPK